jgi:hypothetical protein
MEREDVKLSLPMRSPRPERSGALSNHRMRLLPAWYWPDAARYPLVATAAGLDTASGLASRLTAALRSAMSAEAGQQTNARSAAGRFAGGFATASRLSTTSGLASGLTARLLRSAAGLQAGQQTNARSAAGRFTGGFATTGRSGFTTTARLGTTATEQTSVRTRRADQTEQADRQHGGKNHTSLHWEGSSIQNVCKCNTCLRAAAGPACSHLDGGPTLACAKTPASPSCCIRDIVSTVHSYLF